MQRFIFLMAVLLSACSVAPARPAPTDNPAPTYAPVVSKDTAIYIDVGADTKVDPAWYPCAEGQIKGNIQSKQFYLPTTDRYDYIYKAVVCFDTPGAAEVAGFRLAHR